MGGAVSSIFGGGAPKPPPPPPKVEPAAPAPEVSSVEEVDKQEGATKAAPRQTGARRRARRGNLISLDDSSKPTILGG